jgi:anti-sigma regulatory factor (Ser/Thr protein kinase)
MRATRSFDASERSVSQARSFVSDILGDLSDELRQSVALMVSELATNALVHASDGFEVFIDRTDHDLRVTVADQGPGAPVVRTPVVSDPHGRGLRIVSALADEWGVDTVDTPGKHVWFRMALNAGPEAVAADGRPDAARTDGSLGSEPLSAVGERSVQDHRADTGPVKGGEGSTLCWRLPVRVRARRRSLATVH